MAMQIAVTNQKTKSIRSACSLAGSGSHGISSATAAAPAPNSIPSTTSWTIDPLRTGPRLLDAAARRGGSDGCAQALRNSCNEGGSGNAQAGTRAPQPCKEEPWDLV